ncbi:MAG TPA: sigma-54 dependent transcriptional regulator [Candidatus Eisenbacteria bacterium]|nr:sigma-54 dependent transcriptional regulator [Candidatus Eisenbacteria bacterium]
MAKILLVEDDKSLGPTLQELFGRELHTTKLAVTAEQGISQARNEDFDLVITDLHLAGPTSRSAEGHELIRQLHDVKPLLPIILMTADDEAEQAIKAITLGAYDYVLKNQDDVFLVLSEKVSEALVATQLLAHAEKAEHSGTTDFAADEMVGRGRAMQKVYKDIGRVAAKPVTVLIRCETGTGKESVARALHQYSDRSHQAFVAVNCAAIPETLLESELFGHEQGAFTGAQARRIGRFEQAKKGTIFLDEIGDMNLSIQAKLLRVLQEKTIQRVGGKEMFAVDVRVLAATHRNLEQAVEEKQFRADLYYRLNDAVIRLPPLRERREDIPDLVRYFLRSCGAPQSSTEPEIKADALRLLKYHSWPGNVRELKNVIHKAMMLARGFTIDSELIRRVLGETSLAPQESKRPLQAYVSELLEGAETGALSNIEAALTEWTERELYEQAVKLAEGDQTKIAKWLGVSRPTVRERLTRYGLQGGPDHLSKS